MNYLKKYRYIVIIESSKSDHFYVFQFIYYLYRDFLANSQSYHLKQMLNKTADTIEEISTKSSQNYEKVEQFQEIKIRKICLDLRELSKPLVYNLFEMDRSSFVTVIATALTYIVVLFQFQTSEMPLLQ